MSVITLVWGEPGETLPGVPLDSIDAPILNHPVVRRFVAEYPGKAFWVLGMDDPLPPAPRSHLDIPVTDEQYREYEAAVAEVVR